MAVCFTPIRTPLKKTLAQKWTTIARWGVTPGMDGHLPKQLILCNQMNLVIIGFNTAYLVVDFILFNNLYRSITTLFMLITAFGCLALSKIGRTYLPRVISAFAYSSWVFLYGIFVKFTMTEPLLIHYISPRIPLIMFVFFPFMFLDFKEDRISFWATFGANVFFVLGYDPIHFLLGINMERFGLSLENYHVLTQNSVTFLVNISMGFAFLKLVNKQYEDKIKKLNLVLLRKNESIAAQNEELQQQQEEILSINEKLEYLVLERTASLQDKNRRLHKYAFWNSHKLRAPVATLLGLFNLLEIEKNEYAHDPLLIHLKALMIDLDTQIREMQKLIDQLPKDE